MKIGLLGHGVVGKGVTEIIDRAGTEETAALEVVKILVKDEWEMTDPRTTMNADEILDDPQIDVIVECMGGIEPAHTFLERALKNGKHVVTSNKKMLASCCGELYALANEHGVTIRDEASCGGGIPWMASLERIRRIDEISRFRGIFNGTTNYILSRMCDEEEDFDEMLKNAQELGYAERDPSDDIDGHDVRYKVTLSCIKAFGIVPDMDEIDTFGIRYIRRRDLDYARSQGRVCKLIGTGEKKDGHISASVMPVFLKKEDVLANVSLNYNAIESDSGTLGTAVFIGQGAGSLPTAHAVVQDIIDVDTNRHAALTKTDEAHVCNEELKTFYVRSENIGLYADIQKEKVYDDAVITKPVALRELSRIIRENNDTTVFAAEAEE